MLLLLQNRGRMTTTALASELEVAKRTVLRDVDALTGAGLPVVVLRGARGGIELGFNYRTRLTGLAHDEAEALGVMLGVPLPMLVDLGLGEAAMRARAKLLESLPDGVRETALTARGQFRFSTPRTPPSDARVEALATAIRERRKVLIRAYGKSARVVHPIALTFGRSGWALVDGHDPKHAIALSECGDVNISALRFA